MAWWRVHSRDGSQQAMHMRLHIYDTLCFVQLSNAILAGSAFSCTDTNLSCPCSRAQWHICSVQCWRDGPQHGSHIISDCVHCKHKHTLTAFSTSTATQWGTHRRSRTKRRGLWVPAVCFCVNESSSLRTRHSLHCVASKCQDHILFLFSGVNVPLEVGQADICNTYGNFFA